MTVFTGVVGTAFGGWLLDKYTHMHKDKGTDSVRVAFKIVTILSTLV